jgi:hypothetical protein
VGRVDMGGFDWRAARAASLNAARAPVKRMVADVGDQVSGDSGIRR